MEINMKTRKISIALILLSISISISMIFTGCAEKTIKNVIGGLMDAENKSIEKGNQQENEKAAGDSISNDNRPIGDYDVLKWPGWVPSSIPPYKYGDLYAAQEYDDSGHLYLTNINMKKDPFNAYIKELAKKGWVEDEGWTEPEDKNHYRIYMIHEKDNLFLSYSVVEEDNEVYGSIDYDVNTSSKSDNGDGEDGKFTKDIEVKDAESGEVVSGEVGNETIPEGFPEDLCPIYPGSHLELAQEIKDDDLSTYIVMLLTKDDKDKVAKFYKDNPNVSMTLDDYTISLESEDGKTTAGIQIIDAEEEHTSQGYKTFIMITAGIEK
jgi:hypothetical protein